MRRPIAMLTVLVTLWGNVGCSSSQGDAKDAGDRHDAETTEEGFGSGDGSAGDEDIEPADHDIEVPPAP